MGGDSGCTTSCVTGFWLNSTPPAWAGTIGGNTIEVIDLLKSTPPAWAGTGDRWPLVLCLALKSTPPAWAGTSKEEVDDEANWA